ncbi:U-box domain-containing protein 11-like [Neltuma alba]|uniref:U-box domain-containing protein 11-like n=1 Tax=Neltuma alba TaxID=207710 RepID=UPI0010A47E7F|nr:U-box domain-containing protein 11-like [Prosopis alba]
MAGGDAGDGDRTPELLGLVHDIAAMYGGAACGSSSSSSAIAANAVFKKDCIDLVRRISLLSHLFEEIRDLKAVNSAELDASTSSNASASSWSSDLVFALQSAKRLLCGASNFHSNCISDEAAKTIVFQFQCVTWKLEKLLSRLPYDHLDISEEVREQVELVRTQLSRATERYGSIISNMSSYDISQQLAENVSERNGKPRNQLHKQNSCPEYLLKLDNIPKSNGGKRCSTCQASLQLERARSIPASSEASLSNVIHPESQATSKKKGPTGVKTPEAIVIPEDFLCPISLELMKDPVIVATGQTYERSYIQRWIACGNVTCPKTRQKLENLNLTPNYVLRSLINQWCLDNNFEQPRGLAHGKLKQSDGSFRDVTGDLATIEALVLKLSSHSIEDCRAAVTEIRSLSKRNTDNRILIAEAGAIPVLVNLLTSEDVLTQENAVTSILNLSIYENNKGLVMLAGAIPSIVHVLRVGSMEARENAAATLFNLSFPDENKIIIGSSGAFPPLIELLQNGSPRGKKDAASALFYLCISEGNKGRAVRSGIIPALLKMLADSRKSMVDEALTIMSVLASHQGAKVAIVNAGTMPVLIDLLSTGLPRHRENSAAILFSLCKRDANNLACLRTLGGVKPLTELALSGTERAKRKATSLLEYIRKSQEL